MAAAGKQAISQLSGENMKMIRNDLNVFVRARFGPWNDVAVVK